MPWETSDVSGFTKATVFDVDDMRREIAEKLKAFFGGWVIK